MSAPRLALVLWVAVFGAICPLFALEPGAIFGPGVAAYRAGQYETAARLFAETARVEPSVGSFLNLGNAEWRRGRAGHAVLAWEQTLWIDPFNKAAKNNLELARKAAQLDAPYLAWYEVASSWLPSYWWAWITGFSLWAAVGAVLLPGIFRIRRAAWHQGLSALGLALFLLSLPAHLGVVQRARLGIVLERDTPLRLTPTREAQYTTQLAAGEPVRAKRLRSGFVFVQTRRGQGWVETSAFGAVVPGRVKQ